MDTVLAEKLSALIQYQLPDFVRDNYETFQAFLVAYYEFLEQDGEAQYVLQNSENYKDIDETIDSFVDMFLKQYAYDLPESIFLNQETKELLSTDTYESKRAIAKHLRQYYASKGSESGISYCLDYSLMMISLFTIQKKISSSHRQVSGQSDRHLK